MHVQSEHMKHCHLASYFVSCVFWKTTWDKETDKGLPVFFFLHFWFICFSFYTSSSSSCRRAISHNVDLHSPNAPLWWIPVFFPCLMDHTQQRWDSPSLSLVLFLLLFLFPNCHLLTAVLISAIQTRLVSLTLKSTPHFSVTLLKS